MATELRSVAEETAGDGLREAAFAEVDAALDDILTRRAALLQRLADACRSF